MALEDTPRGPRDRAAQRGAAEERGACTPIYLRTDIDTLRRRDACRVRLALVVAGAAVASEVFRVSTFVFFYPLQNCKMHGYSRPRLPVPADCECLRVWSRAVEGNQWPRGSAAGRRAAGLRVGRESASGASVFAPCVLECDGA